MPLLLERVIRAQSGDVIAMSEIIQEFMPLVISHCWDSKMRLNEDCRQFLLEDVVEAISKFRIRRFNR